MSLTLYYHPLSSFCWKALIALYENGTPFKPVSVNLGDPDERAALLKLWPIGKFPVLRDDARNQTVPESSIIIDYLDRYYRGQTRFTPADGDAAWQTRLKDRFYDLYVHLPTQAIVGNRLRPAGAKDPHGLEEAKARLRTCYDMIEAEMAAKQWGMGESFTIADCSASPSLYYANRVLPFRDTHRHVAAYLDRLMARPAFARVLDEAKPYAHLFPEE
ncbi:MAG: glutathione S-transferase family protein [Rhizobiales bacterium]|nr:glutathione S-transferase family protein [Hyphomicrobiales bacterium]